MQGTAIGTKMVPPYAIPFTAELEESILESHPLSLIASMVALYRRNLYVMAIQTLN